MKRKPKRGRPPMLTPMANRMLVRLDDKTLAALKTYAVKSGDRSASTSLRKIGQEKLRAEGLLK